VAQFKFKFNITAVGVYFYLRFQIRHGKRDSLRGHSVRLPIGLACFTKNAQSTADLLFSRVKPNREPEVEISPDGRLLLISCSSHMCPLGGADLRFGSSQPKLANQLFDHERQLRGKLGTKFVKVDCTDRLIGCIEYVRCRLVVRGVCPSVCQSVCHATQPRMVHSCRS